MHSEETENNYTKPTKHASDAQRLIPQLLLQLNIKTLNLSSQI